jgi:CNT family concentrative nucleoside transporter
MPQARALAGYVILLGVAWLLSTNRLRFPLRTVLVGSALQLTLGLLVLRTQIGEAVFNKIGDLVTVVIAASDVGARFVFGNLVESRNDQWGFVFAARALPTIIVFSSISAIGYHFGILQKIVAAMAWVFQRLMRTSGAESLSAAANVFLGQTEAPLLVRPYIPSMTNSELNAVMACGFATIAGSLIAVYGQILGHSDPAAMSNMIRVLLTASLMSAPAGLLVAKIIVPEVETPQTAGTVRLKVEHASRNVIDAAATGAAEGVRLAINVAAMLIAFIAIIQLIDAGLGWLGGLPGVGVACRRLGIDPLNLDSILGLLFAPVAWLIGLPLAECRPFGSLLGQAMAANEFIAYRSLAVMIEKQTLSPRSLGLAVYALCGFANFSSIAIQIAGIGGMAPDRRHDLARLGLRAMFAGAIACWLTACMAGMLT